MLDSFKDYQNAIKRTQKSNSAEELKKEYALGLSGESGELIDLIKKEVFHGHDHNRDKVIEEMGDILWYLSGLANCYNIDMSEVANNNIGKLKKRYPDGFSTEASINRVN